jgi:APA family basic amino acid/polyamine antiporter
MKTQGHLLRVLGVGFGLAVIIGNTIGAGIFARRERSPNNYLPQPHFCSSGLPAVLYAFLGAISLAELGTMMPRSGGQYVFSRYALGEYAGFIVGWSDWISSCGSTAAVSLVIGTFAGALFPALDGKAVPIAAAVAIIFALLQWRGIVWGSNIQNITSLLKALAFVALIVAAFVFGGDGSLTTAHKRQRRLSRWWQLSFRFKL